MKRKKNSIKFSDKSHATNGIVSTILAGISLVLLMGMIILSYIQNGEAGIYLGSIGLSAGIISIVGLIKGIASFQERERYYLFSKIGSIINAVMLSLWIAIYIIGTWYI